MPKTAVTKPRCIGLHTAVDKEHTEVVELLIIKKANVNAKNSSNETPLHVAVECDKDEAIKALIKDGADINARTDFGSTPMLVAVQYNKTDALNILIEKGADLGAKDKEGKTALHFAVSYGHYAVALVLLTAKVKGFLAKNIVPIVTFLSLVVVGLLAAYFVPQAFLILTGPLLGSLGLIHNLPVLQVTVLSLIGSLGSILVGSLVSRFDGKLDSVEQNPLESDKFNLDTSASTNGSNAGLNPNVPGKGNVDDAQVGDNSPANT